MAKRKKKNKSKKKPHAVKAKKVQPERPVEAELLTVLGELRGRRASVLGERIFSDALKAEPARRVAMAVGQEAYLRELLAKGHDAQVKQKAVKLLEKWPWLSEYWALSLQVRLGLVEPLEACVADPAWLKRLRSELVDPADLAGVEAGELGGQSARVLEAWGKVESGDEAGALELLKGIGRRSPLVDWRLFLQGLVALRRDDLSGMEAAIQRIQEGSPALGAAVALREEAEGPRSGYYGSRLKALEQMVDRGQLTSRGFELLGAVVKRALKDGRPGLACTVALSFLVGLKGDGKVERYFHLFEQAFMKQGMSLNHLYVRGANQMDAKHGLLVPQTLQDIRDGRWSDREAGRIWVRAFGQVRSVWEAETEYMDEWESDLLREELLDPMLPECLKLVNGGCREHEVFDFWNWLEQELKVKKPEAMQRYAEAFPEEPGALRQAIAQSARQGVFANTKRWLKQLEALPGMGREVEVLRQRVLYERVLDAYRKKDRANVEQFAAQYAGDNLFERVHITLRTWLLSSGGEKRKRGLELVALGSPWLVFYSARACEPGLGLAKLPAGLKRALADEPDSVLQGYLDLLENDSKSARSLEDLVLLRALSVGLEHEAASLPLLRKTMTALLMRMRDSYDLLEETDGMMGAFRRLLASSPDDQAAALILRVKALSGALGSEWNENVLARTLRVAWTLAEREETRKLILRVDALPEIPKDAVNKKPATAKMIAAELKMQRKLQDFYQALDKYETREVNTSYSGMPYDPGLDEFERELEEELRRIMGGAIGDFEDAAEEEYVPPPEPSYYEPPLPPAKPKNQPYVFSAFIPSTEMEFERLMQDVKLSTKGKHLKVAVEQLKEMIQASTLSKLAKGRQLMKAELIVSGV